MIKRFPDGTAKPFLTPSEYAELRDDDRFLYNEGTTPSARITGDKGRENPAEGASTDKWFATENQRLRTALQWIADAAYVDHVSGNDNFEYLQQCAEGALIAKTLRTLRNGVDDLVLGTKCSRCGVAAPKAFAHECDRPECEHRQALAQIERTEDGNG